VDDRITASSARAKLYEVVGNFRGRPSAYGTFVSARCRQPDCEYARETLRDFEAGMAGLLPAMGLE
jgi:hypothetical protein